MGRERAPIREPERAHARRNPRSAALCAAGRPGELLRRQRHELLSVIAGVTSGLGACASTNASSWSWPWRDRYPAAVRLPVRVLASRVLPQRAPFACTGSDDHLSGFRFCSPGVCGLTPALMASEHGSA